VHCWQKADFEWTMMDPGLGENWSFSTVELECKVSWEKMTLFTEKA
ncbi:hypothetical protein EI555_012396, partial [Monodon monoceros]